MNMGMQEIFDKSVNHQRAQGIPSANENGRCQYRLAYGDKVLMCAAGPFLSDDVAKILDSDDNTEYSPVVPHSMVEPRSNRDKAAHPFWNTFIQDELIMLVRLQGIHDGYVSQSEDSDVSFLDFSEKRWEELATQYKLTYTPPTK
jgi:hypothetical protein